MKIKKEIILWIIGAFMLYCAWSNVSYALVCNTQTEPKDILGEIFHFDAQDIDGNGVVDSFPWNWENISAWNDGINTHNGTQNVKNKQPSFDSDGINGKGAILFDGKKLALSIENHIDINTLWSYPQKTFAIVFKTWNDVENLQTLFEQWGNQEWYNISIQQGNIYAWVWNKKNWESWYEYRVVHAWSIETNTVYSIVVVHSWNSAIPEKWKLSLYINGEEKSSINNVGVQEDHSWKIGIWYTNANSIDLSDHSTIWNGYYFKWHIWELISWNYALSYQETQEIQNYFSPRWWIPLLKEISKVPPTSNDPTPNYIFHSNKDGTLTYNGKCSWSANEAYVWTNTTTLSKDWKWKNLTNGEYSDCSIELEDNQWNKTTLKIPSFTINNSLKNLWEVWKIPNVSNNNTPYYTFHSPISWNIELLWSCSTTVPEAYIGNNTITLNTLEDWEYNDCSIRIKNFIEETSYMQISPFRIDTQIPTISELTPIDVANNYSYTFYTNENGTVSYGWNCSTKASEEKCVGSNTIFFYQAGCSFAFTDEAGNKYEEGNQAPPPADWWVSYITESGISFWNIQTSNVQREIIIDYALQDTQNFIEIDDLDINSAWYYLTIQSSDIMSDSSSINKNNIEINLEEQKAKNNQNGNVDLIDIPPWLSKKWSGYKQIGTPLVVLERKAEKKWQVGKYKIKPKIKITIPPYQTLGNYTGTITYTLIEN